MLQGCREVLKSDEKALNCNEEALIKGQHKCIKDKQMSLEFEKVCWKVMWQ